MTTKLDRWFKKNEKDLRANFMDAYSDKFMDYCEAEYKDSKEDYA